MLTFRCALRGALDGEEGVDNKNGNVGLSNLRYPHVAMLIESAKAPSGLMSLDTMF